MRNLKKVLALVLALAMALSVMASAFTAPEYSEAETEELATLTAAQKDAFYLVESLGIVTGFPDDTLRLAQPVERAQVAKMIYVAKHGEDTANALFSTSSVSMFSDADAIVGNAAWAIPYVVYAYGAGIIAGYNDGSFRANNNITGYEVAKIVLTALGYDAEIEGLVGPTWKQNIARLGALTGIFKGVAGDLEAEATRIDTIVMIANAISADTVSYVGGVATPKTETLNSKDTITLGEEGFDLLDVEAVLVANSDVALGAYWRNILKNNYYVGPTGAEDIEYRLYQAAPANYARFVYRDYVDAAAANTGAYYSDRVITVALGDQAAKFAELGEMYRILVTDISDVYNNNEYRVLYGYPVEQANDAYYKVTEGEVNGLKAAVIEAMAKRFAAVNGIAYYGLDKAAAENDPIWDSVDNTIFVNGAAKSFRVAHNYDEKKSTAPYKAVDNDNDGVVDALFIYDYTIGTVLAVDGENVTVQGAGLGKIDFANDVELAAGDYVAVWSDADSKFAKKLDVVEANVTGYDGTNWTINGEAKVAGAYMSDSSKSLMATGANALTETVYKYVFDGKYIVNVEATENTRYAKYAIVAAEENGNHSYLHYDCVTLYTEDNEYVTAYLKAVDGVDQNNINAKYNDIAVGDLVSYILDGDYVYLTTAGFDGSTTSDATTDVNFEFVYNRATDTWEGMTTNGIVSFKDTYGVVFVSYDDGAIEGGVVSYRAYLDGEFMPSYYNADEANTRTGKADTVIYAQQNSVNYIKAAKIDFTHEYELPGLPATRSYDNIVIVKNSTPVSVVDGKYVYTVEVYNPWSTATTKYETVPSIGPKAMPNAYGVYNFELNAEGKLVDWTPAGIADIRADVAANYGRPGNFELQAYVATGINLNPSNAIITLSNVLDADNGAQYVSFPINYNADADVWFFDITIKDDGTRAVTAKDWVSYVEYDYNNDNTDEEYIVYVDLDEMRQKAQRIIVVTGNRADLVANPTVEVEVTGTYDLTTKTIDFDMEASSEVPAELALIADGLVAEYENKVVYPWSADYAADGTVRITFQNVNGIWSVKSVSGYKAIEFYSNSVANFEGFTAKKYHDAEFTADAFGYQVAAGDKVIDIDNIEKVYAYNKYDDHLALAASYTDGDLGDLVNIEFNSTTAVDASVVTFEGFFVITDYSNTTTIVLVNTSAGNVDGDVTKYPFENFDTNPGTAVIA